MEVASSIAKVAIHIIIFLVLIWTTYFMYGSILPTTDGDSRGRGILIIIPVLVIIIIFMTIYSLIYLSDKAFKFTAIELGLYILIAITSSLGYIKFYSIDDSKFNIYGFIFAIIFIITNIMQIYLLNRTFK